jgi:hypothetical protein
MPLVADALRTRATRRNGVIVGSALTASGGRRGISRPAWRTRPLGGTQAGERSSVVVRGARRAVRSLGTLPTSGQDEEAWRSSPMPTE